MNPKKKRGSRRGSLLLSVLLLAAAPAGCARDENPYLLRPDPPARPISIQSARQEHSISDVAEALSPAVVGLTTQKADERGNPIESIGSGVIVSQEGYLLTNEHVAGGAWKVSVVFSDGTQAQGRTVWRSRALDLAVVKIDGRFPYAQTGSVRDVRVGEQVVAIGTPLTLQFQHTVTSGIVSAVGRTLQIPGADGQSYMENLIQTDTPINPGNSGGPLINLRGEVVGINSLKITDAEGIGFAIPIDIAIPVLEHFLRDGHYETPYLGLFAFDAEIARFYDEKLQDIEGLFVINVDPQGPGAASGIAQGDVLLSADGGTLATMLDLRCAIFRRKAGEVMEIVYRREGDIRSALVRLVGDSEG